MPRTALLLLVVWLCALPALADNYNGYERIQPGMTRAQVVSIMGRPNREVTPRGLAAAVVPPGQKAVSTFEELLRAARKIPAAKWMVYYGESRETTFLFGLDARSRVVGKQMGGI